MILEINGKSFNYPSNGKERGWGEDASKWAKEINLLLTSLVGSGFIPENNQNLLKNQNSPIDVPGLVFNSSEVRYAVVQYRINISTNSTSKIETGILNISQGTGNSGSWSVDRIIDQTVIPTGIRFSIDNTGQIKYESPNYAEPYVGSIFYKTISIMAGV
jgi:hypothetical protein